MAGGKLVEMTDITKRFPGVVANSCVCFDLVPGEIHALLGENGAGKSTLMSILSGEYKPDEGSVSVEGVEARFHSPQDAIKLGIGMVHQHFMLVRAHTVMENIMLGLAGTPFFMDRKKLEAKIMETAVQYDMKVDPGAYIWQLSVGEQQRVEILKALIRNTRILILDEPTAVLTPKESETLFTTLRRFREEGRTAIFISHKLDEVMAISDRITILRSGKNAGTIRRDETDEKDLAGRMVGKDSLFEVKKSEKQSGGEILKFNDVHANNDRGIEALKGITLSLREGEILGIAGVAGNGQKELAECLFGLRKIKTGTVSFNNKDITGFNPRKIREAGISYIPEDRIATGLVSSLDFPDNLILNSYFKLPVSKGPFLNFKYIKEWTKKTIEDYDIKVGKIKNPVGLLSGGNLQKLILAREFADNPKVVIAASPSRGLDIGATNNARKLLVEQRDRGAGVILISEDLEEIFQISDRIAVMYEGKIMGILDAKDADREKIGLLMGGIKLGQEADI
ncbi:MAG: ABC transporter ATP-binding protein [Firmicutes bacterium]|nr:ABC transporter ATP-binding protein [Bacillota bacterium]